VNRCVFSPDESIRSQQLDHADQLAVNSRLLVRRQEKHVLRGKQTVDDAWCITDAIDRELQTQALVRYLGAQCWKNCLSIGPGYCVYSRLDQWQPLLCKVLVAEHCLCVWYITLKVHRWYAEWAVKGNELLLCCYMFTSLHVYRVGQLKWGQLTFCW